MTRKIGNIVIIESEPDDVCGQCGKTAETRPYGPDGQETCYECAMKNEPLTEENFHRFVEGKAFVAAVEAEAKS